MSLSDERVCVCRAADAVQNISESRRRAGWQRAHTQGGLLWLMHIQHHVSHREAKSRPFRWTAMMEERVVNDERRSLEDAVWTVALITRDVTLKVQFLRLFFEEKLKNNLQFCLLD